MCFQVYVGASQECPEIPYAERLDEQTGFPVWVDLYVYNHPERSVFSGSVSGLTTAYQYHAGIMTCGCGFAYDFPATERWTLNNNRQLGEYVAACLQRA